MALDSNAQVGRSGSPLPHFTPFPTRRSHGVNVFAQDIATQENAYVFPPFILVGPLLCFLDKAPFPFTIVVPKLAPLPYWWPLIEAKASLVVIVGCKTDRDILLFHSTHCVFSTRPLTLGFVRFQNYQFALFYLTFRNHDPEFGNQQLLALTVDILTMPISTFARDAVSVSLVLFPNILRRG